MAENTKDIAMLKDTVYGKGEHQPGLEADNVQFKTTLAKMEGRFDGFIFFAKVVVGVVGFAVVVVELWRAFSGH